MLRAGPVLSVSLFCVAALTCVCARTAADDAFTDSASAQFLGLVVANEVGHDAAGNIVLTGIHHTSLANGFPHQEDVCVYTRWSGLGSHDIGISIWNMDTEETVAEAAHEVEFAPTAVTTFIQVFPHAKFPTSGTYAVEVTLDGDLAAEYSLFINVDDSYPDTPELVLSVPAESGTLDRAGNASVAGIPDVLSFHKFPAQESFELVTLWFSGEGSHQQRVEILDPTGVPVASSPAHEIRADYGKLELLTDSFRDVPLAVRGTYTVVLYMDGEDVFEYPLPVSRN